MDDGIMDQLDKLSPREIAVLLRRKADALDHLQDQMDKELEELSQPPRHPHELSDQDLSAVAQQALHPFELMDGPRPTFVRPGEHKRLKAWPATGKSDMCACGLPADTCSTLIAMEKHPAKGEHGKHG